MNIYSLCSKFQIMNAIWKKKYAKDKYFLNMEKRKAHIKKKNNNHTTYDWKYIRCYL